MKTEEVTNKHIARLKGELLQNYANLLLDNGFRLLIYKGRNDQPVTWIIFEKEGKLGYCQEGYFGGLRFSTVHKPSREAGTGYGLNEEFGGEFEPTIQHALNTFISKPNWEINRHFTPVKYKSLEEYMAKETILKYDLVSK